MSKIGKFVFGIVVVLAAITAWWFLSGAGKEAPGESASETPSLETQTYFERLESVQMELRAQPDHLEGQFEKLIAARDPIALIQFVRQHFDVVPTNPSGWRNATTHVRWDDRGVLRSGSGTPRELANLLFNGLAEMELNPSLVSITPPDELREFSRVLPSAEQLSQTDWDAFSEAFERSPLRPVPQLQRRIAFWEQVNASIPLDMMRMQAFDQSINRLPTVQFELSSADSDDSNSRTANIWSASSDPFTDLRSRPLNQNRSVPEVKVSVLARNDRTRNQRPFVLVEATMSQSDLVGGQTAISFAPVAESLTQLLATRTSEMTTFVPSIQTRSLGWAFSIVEGDAITIAGEVINADEVKTTFGEIDPTAADTRPEIADLKIIDASASHFPNIKLRIKALDASGQVIKSLSPASFTATLDDKPRSIRFSPRSGPRIVFLIDASSSVPEIYRKANLEPIIEAIGADILADHPDASFAVASADGSGAIMTPWTNLPSEVARTAATRTTNGSPLWSAYAQVAALPDVHAIVFFTDGNDGAFEGRIEPPDPLKTRYDAAPPAIMVGSDAPDQPLGAAFFGIAAATGGATLDFDDPDAVSGAISEQLEDQLNDYEIWLRAPDGPAVGEVTLVLRAQDAEARANIQIPEHSARIAPPSFTGLYLQIETPYGDVVRRIAGKPFRSTRQATEDELREVREAFLSQITLFTEAGGPSVSQIYDDFVSAQLTWEGVIQAQDEAELSEALAKSSSISTHGRLFSVPLVAPGETSRIHELGLRYWIETTKIVSRGEETYKEQSVDLLPLTRVFSSKTDLEAAKRETVLASSLLTDLESESLVDSSLSRLVDRDLSLATRRQRLEDDSRDQSFQTMIEGAPRFLSYFVPEQGRVDAGISIDLQTGTVIGLLDDGSGGGRSVEAINRKFEAVDRILAAVQENARGSNIAAWAGLERAKMKKLHQSTIAIATMTPPDVVGEVRGAVCDRVSGAVDGAVEAGIRRVGGGAVGFILDSVQDGIERANRIGNSVGLGDIVSAPSVPIPGC